MRAQISHEQPGQPASSTTSPSDPQTLGHRHLLVQLSKSLQKAHFPMGCISDLRGQGFGEGRWSSGAGAREKGNASEGREKAAPLPRQSYTEEAGRANIILGEANVVRTCCCCRIVAQLAHSNNSCHCKALLEA